MAGFLRLAHKVLGPLGSRGWWAGALVVEVAFTLGAFVWLNQL